MEEVICDGFPNYFAVSNDAKRRRESTDDDHGEQMRKKSHMNLESNQSSITEEIKFKEERAYGHIKTKSHAIVVQANLDRTLPSFVKSLQPSHVSGEYKLGLPKQFSETHLAKHDIMINLINKKQEKYTVKYLWRKFELRLGWKEFCMAHELVIGDALVFQLVKPTEFQVLLVYIVKAHSMTDTNGSYIEHVQEFQGQLDHRAPSFMKSLRPTQVSGKCILGLPKHFCNAYLPNQNVVINLVDEKQEKYQINYSCQKLSLISGWKNFCISHDLVEGDTLVFQLVKPNEFQVYIARKHSMTESNEHNIDAHQKHFVSCKNTMMERTEESHQKISPLSSLEQPDRERSETCSEEASSEVPESINALSTHVGFDDIKSMERFTIAGHGLNIYAELSEQARIKYYDLCCSQKVPLHYNLCRTTNCKLAAGLISQTINIVDAIRASKLTTSLAEFGKWDKILVAIEQLGMNMGFLRARIKKLVNLVKESRLDSKKYREASTERDAVKDGLSTLKAELFGKTKNGSEGVGSGALEVIKFLRTPVEFKKIKSLEGFTIAVNGLVIDSEFSDQARSKYYEMCCSQNAFLHKNLCETINCKLAAGLISQTIQIADDISATKLTTSPDEFAEWDKILGAFEQLGMNVGYLRAQIKMVVNLVNQFKH